MKSKNIIIELNKRYVKTLKNLSIPNKRFVICFSGFSGSGKTYISKILGKRYKAVRIRNDDIRKIIVKMKIKEIDELTYSYLDWLLKNWKFKNKLIILDSGVDRRYFKLLPIFKKNRYSVFIIRLKISKKTAYKRAFERARGKDQHFIDNIDRWIKEWEDFGKNIKSNIVIDNEKYLNLNPLFEILDKRLNSP